jgi:hypothetical protein
MKAGTFNYQDYLDKLHEEAEENTEKGYITTDPGGLPLPEDTKKNFDWLNKEYQKGKVEVKVEVKGEGSSFKPGYDLQTDLKSVKDFKPGMYGDVKTGDTAKGIDPPLPRGNEPPAPGKSEGSPPNSKAENKDPKGGKEQEADTTKTSDKSPKAQSLKVDATAKNNKKEESEETPEKKKDDK